MLGLFLTVNFIDLVKETLNRRIVQLCLGEIDTRWK